MAACGVARVARSRWAATAVPKPREPKPGYNYHKYSNATHNNCNNPPHSANHQHDCNLGGSCRQQNSAAQAMNYIPQTPPARFAIVASSDVCFSADASCLRSLLVMRLSTEQSLRPPLHLNPLLEESELPAPRLSETLLMSDSWSVAPRACEGVDGATGAWLAFHPFGC